MHEMWEMQIVKPEWIKIKDRMPPTQPVGYITYIVAWWSHIRGIYHVGAIDWADDSFQDVSGNKILIDDGYWEITHWMQLPEPPK